MGSLADVQATMDLSLANLDTTTPFAQDADLAASSALPSLPAGCTKCLVSVSGASVRWRPDGATTAPTAAVGMIIPDGQSVLFKGSYASLQALRFIQTAASATLNVCYFLS